jgi:hypothetical protein
MDKSRALITRVADTLQTALYKQITIKHSGDFANVLTADDIVKAYIRSRGLILYGGISIDYALRLKGDKLYADDDRPDYDFWSPANIATAHELVNIIDAQFSGNVTVYGYHAKHAQTMRVSVGSNNWVADISYLPAALAETMPTLTFDGMRFVHPHYQFADLHSSLSFPYDGAPAEVVFARWRKDLERYAKLWDAYPLPAPRTMPRLEFASVAIARETCEHALVTGFAAYSLYYALVAATVPEAQLRDAHIPAARGPVIRGASFLFDVPFDIIEVVTHRDAEHLPGIPRDFATFAPLLELLNMSWEGPHFVAYSIAGQFMSYASFKLEEVRVRAVSIHGLMKHFVACYLRAKYFPQALTKDSAHTGIDPDIFATFYVACRKLAELARDTDAAARFAPQLNVFGSRAPPLHDTVKMYGDIARNIGEDDIPALVLPPKSIKPGKPLPSFDYASCPFMRFSAEQIITVATPTKK